MMVYIITFILGLIIGSFLNVCISRLPGGTSIIIPGSRCPSCGASIRFYDNIPIVSYIILGGRCRECNARISARYPAVELLNAILYVVALNRYGTGSLWILLFYFLFLSSLIVITFIDLEHQIIPDTITLPGIPLALIAGATILPDPFSKSDSLGLQASLIGILTGGGLFYLTAVLGKAVFRKDALGGGDIKMMALVGGVLGWKGVLLTTFSGSLIGSLMGISLMVLKGKRWGLRIPFGPYLAIGTVISLFWGQDIMKWYLYGG